MSTNHDGLVDPGKEARSVSPSVEPFFNGLNKLLEVRSLSPDHSHLGTMNDSASTKNAAADITRRARWATRLVRPATTADSQGHTRGQNGGGAASDPTSELNTSLLRTVADLADKLHKTQATMADQHRLLREENDTIMEALDTVLNELRETQAALNVMRSRVDSAAQKTEVVDQEVTEFPADQQVSSVDAEMVEKRLHTLEKRSKLADETDEMVQDILNDLEGKHYLAQEEASAMRQKISGIEEQGRLLLAEFKNNKASTASNQALSQQPVIRQTTIRQPGGNQTAMNHALKDMTARLEALEYKINFEAAAQYEGLLMQVAEVASQQRAVQATVKLLGTQVDKKQEGRPTPRKGPHGGTMHQHVAKWRDGVQPGAPAGDLQVVDLRTGKVVEDHPNGF